MIEERQGDLFASTDLDAIAHGVNCKGMMGSGIALEFKKRFPYMYDYYAEICGTEGLELGDVLPYYAEIDGRGIGIYNLATQWLPGANADLAGLEQAVTRMVDHAEGAGIKRIGLPCIGAGIGGLDWEDVKGVLNEISETTEVRLVVHYL